METVSCVLVFRAWIWKSPVSPLTIKCVTSTLINVTMDNSVKSPACLYTFSGLNIKHQLIITPAAVFSRCVHLNTIITITLEPAEQTPAFQSSQHQHWPLRHSQQFQHSLRAGRKDFSKIVHDYNNMSVWAVRFGCFHFRCYHVNADTVSCFTKKALEDLMLWESNLWNCNMQQKAKAIKSNRFVIYQY